MWATASSSWAAAAESPSSGAAIARPLLPLGRSPQRTHSAMTDSGRPAIQLYARLEKNVSSSSGFGCGGKAGFELFNLKSGRSTRWRGEKSLVLVGGATGAAAE